MPLDQVLGHVIVIHIHFWSIINELSTGRPSGLQCSTYKAIKYENEEETKVSALSRSRLDFFPQSAHLRQLGPCAFTKPDGWMGGWMGGGQIEPIVDTVRWCFDGISVDKSSNSINYIHVDWWLLSPRNCGQVRSASCPIHNERKPTRDQPTTQRNATTMMVGRVKAFWFEFH